MKSVLSTTIRKYGAMWLLLLMSVLIIMLPQIALGAEYPEILFVGKAHEIFEVQGVFTFQNYGHQDPSKIEIIGIWE